MERFQFKIQDAFQLEVSGLIVAADIKIKDANLKAGDKITLCRADNLQLHTKVESIPLNCPYNPERPFSFYLPEGINKEDIPVGTEVWLQT